MKRLLFLMVILALPLMVWAAEDQWQHGYGLQANVAKDTIIVQHTVGSYQGVCSTAAITTLDSGQIVCEVTGIATLGQGQKLYIGIDTVDGITDTFYAHTYVSVPFKTWGPVKMPFILQYNIKADSNVAIIAPAVRMGCGSSTDVIVVENVLFKVYVLSALES